MIPIHIPPLRERPEDIPPLVRAFPAQATPTARRRVLSRRGDRAAASHCPWPGNARELENVIERALALCDDDEIEAEDLPLARGCGRQPEAVPRDEAPSWRGRRAARLSLHELEERYIEQMLRATGGNKVHAARILGIDRKTLYRRAERRARARTRAPSARSGDRRDRGRQAREPGGELVEGLELVGRHHLRDEREAEGRGQRREARDVERAASRRRRVTGPLRRPAVATRGAAPRPAPAAIRPSRR